MRRFGQLLAVLGLLIGGAAAIAIIFPVHLVGISWLIAVGLIKLTFATSLGLIAGGAVLQRIARRTEERERLSAPLEP
jgi:protein-S-isoprenylcysteine O-methyltransferase Ste14